MDRTVILRLHPTTEQAALLEHSMAAYTACFNTVAADGYSAGIHNSVELHKRTYYSLRARFPDLPAQLVCSARVKASEAVKSAFTRQKQDRKVSQPRARFCPIRYDHRSYRVKWNQALCSLATVGGRVTFGFTVPPHATKYIGGEVASADLIYRQGTWRLHVVVDVPAPAIVATAVVVGVDLGVVRPAVTSTNRFLGQRRWREQERRIFRLKRKLQAKGTRSAKRHLHKLTGKLLRQRKDHDHVLSRRIVQATPPGGTIVLENLTHIRDRVKQKHGEQSRRLHSWSFAQLQGFVRYKAEELGQRVVLVDARHTSQACSRCGYTAKTNRRSQADFRCGVCGYQLNADLNAARNVAAKGILVCTSTTGAGGPVSSGLSSQAL